MKTAKTGNDRATCFHVSSDSHQTTARGGVRSGFIRLLTILTVSPLLIAAASACDPLTGTGPGTQPNPAQFLKVDKSGRTAVVTLIAGHPATDYQFNYDGYGSGSLVLKVPVGWQVTVQCANHGTVPYSCAVVADGSSTQPLQPDWATPDPRRGLDPGQSASFAFTPAAVGAFRIASLVPGSEASGMWLDLEVVPGGVPSLTAG